MIRSQGVHWIASAISLLLLSWSCEKSKNPTGNDEMLEAPSDVLVTVLDYSHINIEWLHSETPIAEYEIERQFDTSGFVNIGHTTIEAFSYVDSVGLSAVSHSSIGYRVRAFSGNDTSGYGMSNVVVKQPKIAFTSSRLTGEGWELFLMNSDGSDTRRLTHNNQVISRDPSWSPDGSMIAYVSSTNGLDEKIVLYHLNEAHETLLSSNWANYQQPRWSPDGTQIAFNASSSIYVVSVDGTNELQIVGGVVGDPHLSWSPDGSRIAFGNGEDIYIINSDGSDLTNLTPDSTGGSGPVWSPDGSQIAYFSSGDIYLMSAGGSDRQRLTDTAENEDHPVFSPDGMHITFRSDRDGNYELYVMAANGTDQTRISDVQGFVWPGFEWSPDGTRIIFTEGEEEYESSTVDIWIVNLHGSLQTNLTAENQDIDSDPTWSPVPLW